MVKRQTVESMERQKQGMVAALYSNSNWDDPKNKRGERILEIERAFNRAMELVYNPRPVKETEIDWSNPFWMAHKRAHARQLARLEEWKQGSNKKMGQVIKMDDETRQRRAELRREVDQVT